MLLEFIDKNTIFYDVGANIGYYSFLLAPVAKKVYGFEPNPVLYRRISETIVQNKIGNLWIYNLGLSDVKSKMEFCFNTSKHDLGSFIKNQNHTESVDIEVNTLNGVIEDQELDSPNVIKIDVEGFEKFVLNGFTPIQEDMPILLVEWQGDGREQGENATQLVRWAEMGYLIFKIGHNGQLGGWEDRKFIEYSNLLFIPKQHSGYSKIRKYLSI